jgi:hypothetical protein
MGTTPSRAGRPAICQVPSVSTENTSRIIPHSDSVRIGRNP